MNGCFAEELNLRLLSLSSSFDVHDNEKFRQMAGRAGRSGFDQYGEAVLICTKDDEARLRELFNSQLPEINSTFFLSAAQLHAEKLLLEAISSELIQSAEVCFKSARR